MANTRSYSGTSPSRNDWICPYYRGYLNMEVKISDMCLNGDVSFMEVLIREGPL